MLKEKYNNLFKFSEYINWKHKIVKPENKELYDLLLEITSFLPENTEIFQRGWHIKHNIFNRLTCKNCKNFVKYQKTGNKYATYCTSRCAMLSPEIKEKLKQTNIEKFGVENPFASEICKEKIKKTNLERYGNEHLSRTKEFREKIKVTMLERYGVETPHQSPEIREKFKKTMLERYGVENALENKEIQLRFQSTILENHGVTSPMLSEKIKEKIKNTNIERYGSDNPMGNIDVRNKRDKTNMERYGCITASQSHISQENIKKLNNIGWLKEQHHDKKRTLEDISIELGVDPTTVHNYLNKFGIDIKYFYSSYSEKNVVSFLLEQIHTIPNVRNIIQPYELDAYVPDRGVAIEYCGLYWHSEKFHKSDYHKIKYEMCKEKNIRLIQIFEDEWLEKKELIKKKLLHILGLSKEDKIYARKCIIKEISQKEKQEFFDTTHIQGNGPSSINLGLFNNSSELVAVIGFIKQKNNEYILNRYSTKANIIGGFTKLLSKFEKLYFPKKLITFADLRWSNGDLYEKTGFKVDKTLNPDYFWTKKDKRLHKFNFRHTGLIKKLKTYDPNLSESENMHANYWLKLYDAGKLRFIKNYE